MGELVINAKMRASGKMKAASQAESWVLVKLIMTSPWKIY
jgi:hypothetical protein